MARKSAAGYSLCSNTPRKRISKRRPATLMRGQLTKRKKSYTKRALRQEPSDTAWEWTRRTPSPYLTRLSAFPQSLCSCGKPSACQLDAPARYARLLRPAPFMPPAALRGFPFEINTSKNPRIAARAIFPSIDWWSISPHARRHRRAVNGRERVARCGQDLRRLGERFLLA